MNEAPRDIEITLPDGRRHKTAAPTTAAQILSEWKPKEAGKFLAAVFEGAPVDLARRLDRSGSLAPLTFEDRAGREILQHSSAHLVARSVTEVIPSAKPTVGPPTEDGFYYDFEVRPFTPEDLVEIEEVMQRSIRAQEKFERAELSLEEARRLFASNPHKLGYLRDTPETETVSVYKTGTFVDLCRGPHVPTTGWLEGVKILGFSGITQGGRPDGLPLQRIRGIGFSTHEELKGFLKIRTEAEARDHRILGPRLGLFLFVEESPGFPFWLPNGMIVVRELERYVREHLDSAGYAEVRTPMMFAQSVFETSGHWDHYRENMFLSTVDDRVFGIKPMNCPGSMLIFRSRARSYRELPLRLAEFAPLHRLEASGTLHGLTRVREMVQDDAHVFVTEGQIDAELKTLLDWIAEAFTTFQLSWSYEFSTRPAQILGDPEDWDRAESALERALKSSGVNYRVSAGEGAFYAPKIDIHIRDSLGRPWQTGTIQLDYQMPRRFGLEYQGPDGQMHTPVVIHRTILGTWERFLGVLIEHCAGRLPPWMAPVQVRVLPVTERNTPHADALVSELRGVGLRAEITATQDTLPKRVREAELDRIPYVVVMGDQEQANNSVALRVRGQKQPRTLSTAEFLKLVSGKIQRREFDP